MFEPEEPDIDVPEAPEADEPGLEDAPPPEAAPGTIAGEPDVVEPDPLAVGRSVEPLGGVVTWAKAGAAANAVAIRHAAICFFSMVFSWRFGGRGTRLSTCCVNAGRPCFVHSIL